MRKKKRQQQQKCLALLVARQRMEREASGSGTPMEHHFLHLIVHGVLHLIGHDHENDDDAAIMEGHEVAILARQGIANPYTLPEKAEA